MYALAIFFISNNLVHALFLTASLDHNGMKKAFSVLKYAKGTLFIILKLVHAIALLKTLIMTTMLVFLAIYPFIGM